MNAAKAPARQWLSIADAADRLGVSTKTIRRYIAAGTIRAERVGPRLIRIDVASLDALGKPLAWVEAGR